MKRHGDSSNPGYRGPCRLCGGRTFRLCYTQGDRNQFRFHRCRSCRLVNADLAAGLGQTKYEATAAIDPLDPRPLRNRVHPLANAFFTRIPVGNKARALIRFRADAATPAGLAPAAKTSADA